MLLADAFGNLAHVEVGRFGTAVHQRFSKEKPGAVAVARKISGWFNRDIMNIDIYRLDI